MCDNAKYAVCRDCPHNNGIGERDGLSDICDACEIWPTQKKGEYDE